VGCWAEAAEFVGVLLEPDGISVQMYRAAIST
jgi:hypothetical protein